MRRNAIAGPPGTLTAPLVAFFMLNLLKNFGLNQLFPLWTNLIILLAKISFHIVSHVLSTSV